MAQHVTMKPNVQIEIFWPARKVNGRDRAERTDTYDGRGMTMQLGIDPDEVCLPAQIVAATTGKGLPHDQRMLNALAWCPCWGKKNHEDANAATHKPHAGFTFDLVQNFRK